MKFQKGFVEEYEKQLQEEEVQRTFCPLNSKIPENPANMLLSHPISLETGTAFPYVAWDKALQAPQLQRSLAHFQWIGNCITPTKELLP